MSNCQGGARAFVLSAIRHQVVPRTPGPGSGAALAQRTSSTPILLPGPAGEGHAVPGPLGNAETALGALWHLLEQIGWRPVDELDERTVRESADDLERKLVHDVRRNRDLVRGRMAADTHRLGKAVGAADVRHEIPRGAALDEVTELEARVIVLAGCNRDLDGVRDFGAGRDV